MNHSDIPIDIEIDLPVPLSVNEAWQIGKTRDGRKRRLHASPQYKLWIKRADALTLTQKGWRNKRLPGRYSATLILNELYLNPRQDGDNLLKVVLDYAVRLGLVVDDSVTYCREWHVLLGTDDNAPTGARLILRPSQR